jgi:hypothetical protein
MIQTRMSTTLTRFIALALLLTLAAGSPLRGQIQGNSSLERFDRQLELIQRETDARALSGIPADKRALIDYGGYLSLDYFSVDDSNNQNHGVRQYQAVGYARFNLDAAQEAYVRVRAQYNDFNTGDEFEDSNPGYHGYVDRAYYKFDSQGYQRSHGQTPGEFSFTAEGGRDLAYWGNGLTLSEVITGGFIHTGWNQTSLDFLAGITPEHTVDIDFSRPHFEDNTNRGFYGSILSQQIGKHKIYAYALLQRDYNSDNVGFTSGIRTKYDYNSNYFGFGAQGAISDRLLYGVECVYENGDNLSNSFTINGPTIDQINQDHNAISASAFDGRLDYLLLDRRKTRFSAEVIGATGDDDRLQTSTTFAGNKPGTADRAFNGFGLLNTGLAFAPEVSNVLIFRVGGVTFPLPDHSAFARAQVGLDLFFYNKFNDNAPINEPTYNKAYLGFEPDIFLNWQITSDVTLAIRYGIFFPGAAIVNDSENRQFFGAGVTYAF